MNEAGRVAQHGQEEVGRSTPEPWFIVACCVMGTAFGGPTLAYFGLGGFIHEIANDLQWTHVGASKAISVYFLGLGISVIIAGLIIDYIGPRRTAIPSIILLACSLLALSLASSKEMVLAICLTMGLVAGATTGLPYAVVITSRFHRSRGLAIGICAASVGLGGAIVAQIGSYAIEHYSWRAGLQVLAVLMLLLSVPSAFIGLKLGGNGARRDGKVARFIMESLLLFRDRSFLLILGALVIANIAIGGVAVSAISFLLHDGFDRQTAGIVVSAVAVASIFGRLVCGYFMDRHFGPYVAACLFLVGVVGLLLMLVSTSLAGLLVAFVFVGITMGAETDMNAFLVSKYVPVELHGRAIGTIIGIFLLSNGVGVYLLSYSLDMLGSYRWGIAAGAVLVASSCFLVTRLRSYRPEPA